MITKEIMEIYLEEIYSSTLKESVTKQEHTVKINES